MLRGSLGPRCPCAFIPLATEVEPLPVNTGSATKATTVTRARVEDHVRRRGLNLTDNRAKNGRATLTGNRDSCHCCRGG